MSKFSQQFLNPGKNNAPVFKRLALYLALIITALWLTLDFVGTQVLNDAYQGQSIALLNSLITGQSSHPVTEYLAAYNQGKRILIFTLIVLSFILYIVPNAIRYQAHKCSVTHLNVGVFIALSTLIILRDPTLFLEPRFWAEEATVYFRTAYMVPVGEALIAPHQGYFSLWANLAGVLATLPPLEYAPLVTTTMSMLVVLLILITILINESVTLNSTLKKAIAGILVVFVGANGEIWLTSINSQHYLPLLVFLILIDQKQHPLKRRVYFFIAAVAGLSSVAVNFLAPLFLLRYLQHRVRADRILFYILLFTSTIQLLAITYSFFYLGAAAYYHPTQSRAISEFHLIPLLSKILFYSFAYPFFGFAAFWGWLGALVALCVAFMARSIRQDIWMFPAAIILLTSLSILSSLGMLGGPRYAYSAAVILLLHLMNYSFNNEIPTIARKASSILIAASIAYWAVHFLSGLDNFRDPQWPIWSEEVKKWHANPNRSLQAHPIWANQTAQGLVWAINLPPE